MVISTPRPSARRRGALLVELLVAMVLLAGALLPAAYSVAAERRLARASYQRAVAMELVDGEIETLAAGEWRAFPSGTCEYPVRSAAAANLPPGGFWLTVQAAKVRLEWRPSVKQHGGPIVREVRIQ